jgi:NAD(P)-dependent dehydrogenase (short-subunit alcohol dehydrogenase family)
MVGQADPRALRSRLRRARQACALHPVGRLGEISDIVGAIMYLETAGFVTGEILHVDGGQSAGH